MAKRIARKRRRKPPQKKVIMPEEETRSHCLSDPNATLSTKSAFAYEQTKQLLSEDSTGAPRIGEKTEEEESYAQSYPALIDKYISRTGNIPFIFIIGGAVTVICYALIQDNKAGKLANLQELTWAIEKSGIILGFFIVLLVLTFLFQKMFK